MNRPEQETWKITGINFPAFSPFPNRVTMGLPNVGVQVNINVIVRMMAEKLF